MGKCSMSLSLVLRLEANYVESMNSTLSGLIPWLHHSCRLYPTPCPAVLKMHALGQKKGWVTQVNHCGWQNNYSEHMPYWQGVRSILLVLTGNPMISWTGIKLVTSLAYDNKGRWAAIFFLGAGVSVLRGPVLRVYFSVGLLCVGACTWSNLGCD